MAKDPSGNEKGLACLMIILARIKINIDLGGQGSRHRHRLYQRPSYLPIMSDLSIDLNYLLFSD